MNNNEIKKVNISIKKDKLSPAYLKQILNTICDDDYTGFGGSEKYVRVNSELFKKITDSCYGTYVFLSIDNEYGVAPIDYRWYEITKDFTDEEIVKNAALIIQDIIDNNYYKNPSYNNVRSYMLDCNDTIVVKVEGEIASSN